MKERQGTASLPSRLQARCLTMFLWARKPPPKVTCSSLLCGLLHFHMVLHAINHMFPELGALSH